MSLLASRKQKVDWLIQHPDLWRAWPRDEAILFKAMQDADLFSHSTKLVDMDLSGLVGSARMELRKLR
jgi:hypothetical protein